MSLSPATLEKQQVLARIANAEPSHAATGEKILRTHRRANVIASLARSSLNPQGKGAGV